MFFIGDIHGKFGAYRRIIKNLPESIQVGDMGVGFNCPGEDILSIPSEHRFIRGNHDDPQACKQYVNYLGDFGFRHIRGKLLFYVSGAYSIDKNSRILGISWWEDEELSYQQFARCIELYERVKPDWVVSHECPAKTLGQIRACTSDHLNPTTKALQMMFDIHQPELWVFGHHHYDKEFDMGKTHFVLLGSASVYEGKTDGN